MYPLTVSLSPLDMVINVGSRMSVCSRTEPFEVMCMSLYFSGRISVRAKACCHADLLINSPPE